jgi:hypothetical protein
MKKSLFLLLFACCPLRARASDAWVILGRAAGGGQTCGGPAVVWTADAVVRNFGADRATVQVIHDSSGGVVATPATIDLDPGYSVSMVANTLPQALFVRHVDLPQDVIADGRLELSYYSPCTGAPPAPGPGAKVSLPVFKDLTPAGQKKIIPGTDIGYSDNARINVGIYNSAQVTAVATIDVRRGVCEGVRREVTVPADTLVQFSLPLAPKCDATLDSNGLPWAGFTTVTVDQPSLSYAVVLSNAALPTATFSVARASYP